MKLKNFAAALALIALSTTLAACAPSTFTSKQADTSSLATAKIDDSGMGVSIPVSNLAHNQPDEEYTYNYIPPMPQPQPQPVQQPAPPTVIAGFLQNNQGVSTGSCDNPSLSAKPDTKHFMDRTGADFATAASILGGVIGANGDGRDWNAIMASSDPLSAARAATYAMYNGPYCRASYAVKAPFTQGGYELTIVAEVKNYQFQRQREIATGKLNYWVAQVDGEGYMLTTFANCTVIAPRAINFGSGLGPIQRLAPMVRALHLGGQADTYFDGCF